MSAHPVVHREHAEQLRRVLMSLQQAVESAMDVCDNADLAEIISMTNQELEREQPRVATLETYLNSVARSVRHEPSAMQC